VDAEINNVIYMELNSGAKMADGKYQKTYVAGSVDRENTVYGTWDTNTQIEASLEATEKLIFV
jgi:hypothetical protein